MGNNGTILIIDDEEHMRDSCRQVLTKVGYRAETAEDGAVGLRKLRETEPDLVLIDLKMPGLSGMEVLEKVLEFNADIVPVVITGYATVESAVESMKRGAYDFLPKPFTPDELRLIVRRGLEKRRLALESASLRREKEMMREFFITLVSHELRSPLVSVQQYFETILGGFVGEVTSKQGEIIRRCQERIQGLLNLIEDWLNVSRIDKGAIVENLEQIHLIPILTEVAESMAALAERSKVVINLECGDKPPLITGDSKTLKVLFSNLVGNAIKYNIEGGTVGIKVREEGDRAVVEVSDTGVGISEKHLPFIFDEFYRVKNDAKRNPAGSGLGLSFVKKIVEAHSGSIKVSSAPGQGSTFSVYLPKL